MSGITTLAVTTGAAVGGATPRTSGIAFPATAVAVADANTLDDYEEGTWTPSVGGTATYTAQSGTYTKIGRLVFITGAMTINVIGTGSANTISGLPFTAAGNAACSFAYFRNLALNVVYLTGQLGGTTIALEGLTAAAASTTDPINAMGSGTSLQFSATYSI